MATTTSHTQQSHPEILKIDEDNARQRQAFNLIANTNQSFFLTGRAGTGKTTFLKKAQQLSGKQFIVVAPTGIAAIVAGGVTIHSFFGLDLHVLGPKDHGHNFSPEKLDIVRASDTIIIDEVSMVRCDVIDAIDRTLRMIMRTSMPFGGKQMVFSGDMFQLPPVLKNAEAEAMREFYDTDVPFFFKAHVFNLLTLPTIEFEKVYRQEEPLFLNILADIRGGHCSSEHLAELNARCIVPSEENGPVIALTPRKDTAQKINEERLAAIDAPAFSFEGILQGSFAKKDKDGQVKEESLPAPMVLTLKKGAQVMFTRNDPQHRWVNGSLGEVVSLSDNTIEVMVGNQTVSVEQVVWESYDYNLDREAKKVTQSVAGSFTQYPLRLAWAITIHKSQGLTFSQMVLDLSRGTFAAGQLYVALSRVRSLDGLYLTRPVRYSDIRKDDEVLRFAAGFNDDNVIEQQIEEGKALYPFLKRKDYDGAARAYLGLAKAAVEAGHYRVAASLFKKMLNVMIADAPLMGKAMDIPLITGDSQVAWFCNAVVCLFSHRYEEAVAYANKLLAVRRLYEAMYIKTRALFALGRNSEADELDVEMSEVLNDEQGEFDNKFLWSYASVNEAIGDPCLGVYLKLAVENPKYMLAHAALHAVAHKLQQQLSLAEGYELPLLSRQFNEIADTSEFLAALNEADEESLNEYLEVLTKQSFSL